MPIYHREIAQYSSAYDRLKLGLPTSSNFSKLITAVEGKRSSQWRAYAHHLIAERMLGRKDNSYTSPFMERGLALEQDATDWYEWIMGESEGGLDGPIQTIGFITTDDGTVGCTPDRLIGDVGLLEVKCAMPTAQVGYLLEGVDREHWPQLQGQLLVTEPDREFNDIVAYHDELDRAVVRVYRDEPYIKKLKHELDHLLDYIADSMAKIEAKRRGLPPPPDFAQRLSRRLTADPRQDGLDKLKEDLQASLAREDKARSAGTVAAQTEVVGDRPMPGVLPHQGPGESSAPLPSDPSFKEWLLEQPIVYGTEPIPEPNAGGVARPERGRTVGEASANLASPKTCEQCDGPCDEAGYCRNPNCSAHWAYTSSSRESQTPGAEPGANSRRASGGERQTWTCGTAGCGMVFDSYSTFSKHRQRTGHKAETEQRPEALQAGRSSSGQDTVIAGLQVGVNTETRVRVPPDSKDQVEESFSNKSSGGLTEGMLEEAFKVLRNPEAKHGGVVPAPPEETFWDIAARSGDYKVEIPDKNIATLGRDQMMGLISWAPSLGAMVNFCKANQDAIQTMARARRASFDEFDKTMIRRKKELSGE